MTNSGSAAQRNDANKNILVFDSGVGGLSIVTQIRRLIPSATISYLADNCFFPYGLLDEKALIERVSSLIFQSVRRYPIDVIVIACNTASTSVLPSLRSKLDIPIVGVVPAIKPAAQKSRQKVIGILATAATVEREYTAELVRDFAGACEVIPVGSSRLVEVVERSMLGEQFDLDVYRDILEPFFSHPKWELLDTIVLACTHFPLAVEQLSKVAPSIEYWVDSGEAIARRVESLLQGRICESGITQANDRALLTDFSNNRACIKLFNRYGFDRVEGWSA